MRVTLTRTEEDKPIDASVVDRSLKGLCILVNKLPLPDVVPHPIVSPVAVIASLLTLGLITVAAGMYPAQRAATLSPMISYSCPM